MKKHTPQQQKFAVPPHALGRMFGRASCALKGLLLCVYFTFVAVTQKWGKTC